MVESEKTKALDEQNPFTKVSENSSMVTVVKNDDGSETIVVTLAPIVVNMREVLSNANNVNSQE